MHVTVPTLLEESVICRDDGGEADGAPERSFGLTLEDGEIISRPETSRDTAVEDDEDEGSATAVSTMVENDNAEGFCQSTTLFMIIFVDVVGWSIRRNEKNGDDDDKADWTELENPKCDLLSSTVMSRSLVEVGMKSTTFVFSTNPENFESVMVILDDLSSIGEISSLFLSIRYLLVDVDIEEEDGVEEKIVEDDDVDELDCC